MISSVTNEFTRNSTAFASTANSSSGGFDAALQAEQTRKAQEAAVNKDLEDIREKGFRAWAKDVSMEVLKEKLRKKLEAQLGEDQIDPDKLAAIIEQMLEKEMEQATTASLAGAEDSANSPSGMNGQGNIFPQGMLVADAQGGTSGTDKDDGVGFFLPSMM